MIWIHNEVIEFTSKLVDFYALQKIWAETLIKSLLASQKSWKPMPLRLLWAAKKIAEKRIDLSGNTIAKKITRTTSSITLKDPRKLMKHKNIKR